MKYDDVVAFYAELRRRISANDQHGVAAMTRFPLRVNTTKPNSAYIETAAEFERRFAEVFTPATRENIQKAEPGLVFCNWQGAMLGSGVLWASVWNGTMQLYIVNVGSQ